MFRYLEDDSLLPSGNTLLIRLVKTGAIHSFADRKIRLAKTRGLHLPDESQEGRNRSSIANNLSNTWPHLMTVMLHALLVVTLSFATLLPFAELITLNEALHDPPRYIRYKQEEFNTGLHAGLSVLLLYSMLTTIILTFTGISRKFGRRRRRTKTA
ncbi:hypothetical protein CSKR_109805 [Clonorchis sinensis]|uniref:Uncharacterized protein n=1 Tax=Clonorchis sinensis TaxID=79923 RepID=A0A3R7DM84_CLOSI|nr:hypothetical protein CSKR_109805 [Clonorchis sinensis]